MRECAAVHRLLWLQYLVCHDDRDQCRDEGYQNGDGDADDAVSVLAVPQIHSSPPCVKAYGAIRAGKRDGRVKHPIAAPRVGNEAPVLQVPERQFELRGDQLGANVLGKLGCIEALKLSILVPDLAFAQGMHRQPQQLLAGDLYILIDVLAVVVQADRKSTRL